MTKPPSHPEGKLIHIDDISWDAWTHGDRFGSRCKSLGSAANAVQIGINLEEVAPGKQAGPLHYHLLEEEHLWVLEGEATLRWGEESIALRAGHYVCFPARDPRGHCIVNHSDAPFRFLIVGNRAKADVCVYPDSDKVLCRATGEMYRKAPVDYWDGE